jgi:hypothetical protein
MGPAPSLTLLQMLIAALSGLLGALIGGGAILIAARKAAEAAAHRTQSELLRQRGEELVALLCEAEYWHRGLGNSIADFERPFVWPAEPYRVSALVEGYFRGLSQDAVEIEAACRKYRVFLLKARQHYIDGIEEGHTELGTLHTAISIAAHALRDKVLTAMQES